MESQKLVVTLYSNDVGGAEILMYEFVKSKRCQFSILCIFHFYDENGLDFRSLTNVSVLNKANRSISDFSLAFSSLLKILLNFRPDTILTNAWVPYYSGILFSLMFRVVHFHHSDYRLERLGSLRRLIMILSKYLPIKQVVLSPSISQGLMTDFRIESSVIHNPNRLNYSSNDFPIVKTQEVRILFVGRLVKEKGIEDLKRIIEHYRDEKIYWDIVGPGEAFMVNSDKVYFHGAQESLELFYKRSHYLINVSKREGFGNTIVEALCFGCLPLCYPLSGPNYIHELHERVELSETCDYKAMIVLIDLVISQPRVLTTNDIKLARRIFSKDIWLEKVERIIRDN